VSSILELDGVTRVFGAGHTETVALRNVSLSVQRGEMVAVMGPSGSGKTTLLSLSGGLDRPTAGTVSVDGSDLASLDPAAMASLRRAKVGYVFQQYNLIDALTAVENVSLPLELDGVPRRAAAEQAMRALASVEMGSLAGRFPIDLSGGEQQRVAIARAIIGDRLLLLADEPTGALDSVTGEAVLGLLRQHCDQGGATVLVTHDARFAAWADRVMFLRDGQVVDQTRRPQGPESLLEREPAR
jgi:putative ABC transport system ATP-binding protein